MNLKLQNLKTGEVDVYNLPTWKDQRGHIVYPERSLAGLKFEQMASIPFKQAPMNFNFLLDHLWGLPPRSIIVQMLQGEYQHGNKKKYDLSYECNYIHPLNKLMNKVDERLRVEFKFIPMEKWLKNGSEKKAVAWLFHPRNRAIEFCRSANNSHVPVVQMLVIGIGGTPTKNFLNKYDPQIVQSVYVVAYLPTHNKGIVRKATARFNSFLDYASAIHSCVCPEQIFENVLKYNGHEYGFQLRKELGIP